MLALEYIVIGALSAIRWWGSNHYLTEPYFPEPIPKIEKNITEKN
jgi:hypothetical protein